VIPAGLARLIAADPDSTWYRMLTDPHGHLVELSTKSYKPTATIWRHVVARDNTCYRSNCNQPATDCELDHRVPWPHGPTATSNLAPGCRRDHKAKHADGFALTQHDDGSLTLRTRAGFTHHTEPTRHPASTDWPDGDLFGIQHTATELLDAIQLLTDRDAAIINNVAAAWQEEKLWASYRESYPDATDEDIDYWIHGAPGEPEHEHAAPPLLKEGTTAWERAAADNLAWANSLGISA
jgi:hypothetical protein